MTGDSKKVWEKLFNPPCPLCGSADAVELRLMGGAIICGKDIPKILTKLKKGLPPDEPDVKCFRCNKCHTVFDNRGGRFQVR